MAGGPLHSLLRQYAPRVRARGAVLRKVARKLGLVYFGTVNQHNDDHDIIRGLTVSTTHKDTHYAVGAYDGYDISLVDRFDVVSHKHGSTDNHEWVILRISLRDVLDHPHLFMLPVHSNEHLYSSYFTAARQLHPLNQLFDAVHSQEFHGRYKVYGMTSRISEIENVLSPQISQVLAARFWPHAIELFEGSLYVYITEHRLTETVLGSAVESALWLAAQLDNND